MLCFLALPWLTGAGTCWHRAHHRVLLGSCESIKGWDLWQPSPEAFSAGLPCLWRTQHVIIVCWIVIIDVCAGVGVGVCAGGGGPPGGGVRVLEPEQCGGHGGHAAGHHAALHPAAALHVAYGPGTTHLPSPESPQTVPCRGYHT